MVDIAEIKIWGEYVGALRWDERKKLAFFQYAPGFLSKGWDLSPLQMPISRGSAIHSFPELRMSKQSNEDTFKGLPGLLADSLPDKYGHSLINSWLAQQGRTANSMNPVEKLCFIGHRGMGALEFEPAQVKGGLKSFGLEVSSLVEIAKKIKDERSAFKSDLNTEEHEDLKDLFKVGTSAGGARPKAIIAYNEKTLEVRSGQAQVPKGFEHWLIKLDGVSSEQFGESSHWGRVEYAYYLMALDCGIKMSKSRLLEESGRAHFMTKRFDREGNTKHHIQTLCGLQHYDYNEMYSFGYEQVFQTMRQLRLSYPEAEQMFRRMVFNVLATNYDDHTKNFSFLLKKDQKWELAPAYDLCFSFDPSNHWVSQQTLSVNSKRLSINETDLLKVGKENSIKKAAQIIAEINSVVRNWQKYAEKAAVQKRLADNIELNLNTLSLG
ncbi:MAG: toxin HipA [Bacteroidetes bacterium]|nr:MAG: toxin HipA [Bacteroidota bacterium]